MYIHTYTENGEEKELRASDFKNWEVTGFKYPGYLEELEEIAVNAYRWNSHSRKQGLKRTSWDMKSSSMKT